MNGAKVILERETTGCLLFEDQDGRPVGLWHPDMEAFDKLPQTIREFMCGMINPPPARNVLASCQVFGLTVTLNQLREIDFEDRIKAKVV